MADKKLTEVDVSTNIEEEDSFISNIGNTVRQIKLSNLVLIIKEKIGSLKNPYSLTFTGAVNDTYDGSEAKTIDIPIGGSSVTIDDALSETSTNPVQNKVINEELALKISKPLKNQNGTNGQVLKTNGDGTTEWIDANMGGDVVDVDAELKEYMLTAKPAIAQAIINKGGTIEDTDSFNDYANRINEIPNGVSAAQTLPEQTNLSARSTSSGIVLNWRDVEADGYLIVRKTSTVPETSADGMVVYNGIYTSEGYNDTAVSYGNTYCYRIFPRNSANQYQSIEGQSIATVEHKDRSGQIPINELNVGDTIKFGQYGNSMYTWTVVDTLDKDKGYVTVVANQYPGLWQFDAPENASDNPNPNTDRKNSGNNRWAYSNIRQVLNSDGEGNTWFEKQHDYDVKPNYVGSAGFLKDFTEYEKSIIVNKTNKCILSNADGGGSETVIDKIWLPSSYAMGLEVFQPLEDDHVYEYFISNTERLFSSNYWLRTINGTSSSNSVRNVFSSGALSNDNAYSSNAARPFCQLPTSAYMQWSESDNAYIFADDSQRNPSI